MFVEPENQLALTAQPTEDTLQYAAKLVETIRNPPLPDPGLTWKDILAEEPFEGQHWEGAYGLPAEVSSQAWPISLIQIPKALLFRLLAT